MRTIRQFLTDTSGATVIEYCFIGASVALVIVTGLTSVGAKLNGYFVQIAAVN